MDTVVSGFAGVGRVFSYIGLIIGILVGIGMIIGGSYVLNKDNYIGVNATVVLGFPTPTVNYNYNGQNFNSILYNVQSGVAYTSGQTINVFIRSSSPGVAYAQPSPKGLGIGLIAGGFAVMTAGMLNTYFVRKYPGYASFVGIKDVIGIGIGRSHPFYGLI
jgi:hypothetical protein